MFSWPSFPKQLIAPYATATDAYLRRLSVLLISIERQRNNSYDVTKMLCIILEERQKFVPNLIMLRLLQTIYQLLINRMQNGQCMQKR